MTLYENIPFTHEGSNFELRIMFDEKCINVLAFLNRYPANGFRYQILFPKRINPQRALESDAVKHLVELCRNDIVENRWQELTQNLA